MRAIRRHAVCVLVLAALCGSGSAHAGSFEEQMRRVEERGKALVTCATLAAMAGPDRVAAPTAERLAGEGFRLVQQFGEAAAQVLRRTGGEALTGSPFKTMMTSADGHFWAGFILAEWFRDAARLVPLDTGLGLSFEQQEASRQTRAYLEFRRRNCTLLIP